eukprot:6401472-Prymnesium_polylepis.2
MSANAPAAAAASDLSRSRPPAARGARESHLFSRHPPLYEHYDTDLRTTRGYARPPQYGLRPRGSSGAPRVGSIKCVGKRPRRGLTCPCPYLCPCPSLPSLPVILDLLGVLVTPAHALLPLVPSGPSAAAVPRLSSPPIPSSTLSCPPLYTRSGCQRAPSRGRASPGQQARSGRAWTSDRGASTS